LTVSDRLATAQEVKYLDAEYVVMKWVEILEELASDQADKPPVYLFARLIL